MGQAAGISRTTDARGRSVRMLDPVKLHALHQYDTIDEDALRDIVEDLQPGSAKFLGKVYLIVIGTVAAIALLLGFAYWAVGPNGRPNFFRALANPALYPGWITGIFVPIWAGYHQRMKRMRGVLLKHCRCPHCGYDLRGTPPDPSDGATVCSECGSAWQVQRDAETAPPGALATHSPKQRRALIVLSLVGVAVFLALVIVFLALR